MRARLAVVALSLFVPLVSMACAEDDQDDTVSEEQAAEVTAAFVCDAYYECSCEDWEANPPFSSEDQCKATIEADIQGAIDEAKAAGLTYDSTCIPKLREAIDAIECRITDEIDFINDYPLFVEADDCKLYRGVGKQGDSCEMLELSDNDDCGEGLRCVTGTCEPWGDATMQQEGQPCTNWGDCAAGTVCVDVEGNGDGTCEVLPRTGETCLGVGDVCEFDGYCDQDSKTCRALPQNGESCLDTASWFNRVCDQFSVCGGGGFCEAAPGEGDDCESPGWNDAWICEEGTTCSADSFTCEARQPMTCGVPWEILN